MQMHPITGEELKKMVRDGEIGESLKLIRHLHPFQGDSLNVGGKLVYIEKRDILYFRSETESHALFPDDMIETQEKVCYCLTDPI